MSVSQLKPLTKPTNRDLDKRIVEVHECVHKVGVKVDRVASEGRKREKALKAEIDGVNGKVEDVAGDVDLLKRLIVGVAGTVGAPTTASSDPKKLAVPAHRRFGNLKTWQAGALVFGSVSGALTLIRVADALLSPWFPKAWAFVWHVLTTIH